jgi:hypothetical protein
VQRALPGEILSVGKASYKKGTYSLVELEGPVAVGRPAALLAGVLFVVSELPRLYADW